METTLTVSGLDPATKYTFRARCGKLLAGSTGLEEGMEDSVIVSLHPARSCSRFDIRA